MNYSWSQPGRRVISLATRSDTLSSLSSSTISGPLDRAPFLVRILETKRSALVTEDFFTREGRVPSSESYGRVAVPKWSSKVSRAALSSSRSVFTFAFSALASAIALRFRAPCDRPFADPDPYEVVSSSSCFVAFASWEFVCFCLISCSFFSSAAARVVVSSSIRFCISACCAATCVACCCASACRTCRS